MRRPGVISSLFALIGFCILIALGVWQVQRLKWKTDLLHRFAVLQTAVPRPIDQVLQGLKTPADADFTRVRLDCPDVETRPVAHLFTPREGLMGYRLIVACPLTAGPYRTVLVDRGFIGQQGVEPPRDIPGALILRPVIGVLHKPDGPNFVTPKNEAPKNLWYWLDIPAMATALHAGAPAPLIVLLESPAPANGVPRPTSLPSLPNNHLGYAITWFGLAAALVGVYLARLFRKPH